MSSYKDEAKAKSREKLREFIQKSLLPLKETSKIKAVCFPGAEVKGEEAIEVIEVYDKLGIPRENITGLEYDVKKAERLMKAKLGINIVNSSDLEFFKTTKNKFDIISLDYCSNLKMDVMESIAFIAGRKILKHEGVLATNLLAQREAKMYSQYMGEVVKINNKYHALFMRMGGLGGMKNVSEDQKRDHAITSIIGERLRSGKLNLGPTNALTSSPRFEEILDAAEKRYAQADKTNNLAGMDSLIRNFYEISKFSTGAFMKVFATAIYNELEELGIGIVAIPMQTIAADGYGTKNLKRYSYMSNKRNIMYMDLMQLVSNSVVYSYDPSELRFHFEKGNRRIWLAGHEVKRNINNEPHSLNRQLRKMEQKVIEKYNERFKKYVVLDPPERIFLGSSYKHKERISKEDALLLLSDGCTPQEITDSFSGFTKMQLAAIKAHITMGTYSQQNITETKID